MVMITRELTSKMKRGVLGRNSFWVCAVLPMVAVGLQATPIPVPGCSSLTSLPGPSFTCVAGNLTYNVSSINLPSLNILYTVTASAGQSIDNVAIGSGEDSTTVTVPDGISSLLSPGKPGFGFAPTSSVTILGLVNPSTPVNGNTLVGLNTITDPPVATPEPGFYGLLAVGLGAIFMYAKR